MKTKNTKNKPSKKASLAVGKRKALAGVDSTRLKVIEETASVIPFVLKTLFICGVGYVVYRSYTNRFKSLKENPNYPMANISLAQAKTRADAIANSIGWVSNDFDTVASNLSGLNYNGFVRLYNAFGTHRGTLFAGELNLVEWIRNQFDDEQIQELSFLTNGVFFKGSFSGNAIVLSKAISYFTLAEKQEFIQLLYDTTRK